MQRAVLQMTGSVVISSYQKSWPVLFEQEAALVRQALGENCVAVHHIGSTAVPDLPAKPIIDMLPVVHDILAVDSAIEKMQQLGFESKGENGIFFRRFFQKGQPIRTHNVHVFEVGCPEIERHLKFRDWMRTHPGDRLAYATLKTTLAQQYPDDILNYCFGKDQFVANIDKKTGFTGIRIVKTLTPREWESYHRIRKEQIFDGLGLQYDLNHPTLSEDNHHHLSFYKETELVGAAHLEFLADGKVFLRHFALDSAYQNLGLGAEFLYLVEKWLKQMGKTVIYLQSMSKTSTFYQKSGYVAMDFAEAKITDRDTISMGKFL